MPTEILQTNGTPIVFADATDFSGTNSGFTRTAQIDLTSLASTKARQSDKVDLGENRAARFTVKVAFELDVAPVAGTFIPVYWSSSHSSSAAVGNDGGCSGSDSAYKDGEELEWVKQLILIGVLVLTADAATTVQTGIVGVLQPPDRYGQVVVLNSGGQAFEGDAAEMYVALIPIIDEAQTA